MFDPLSIGLLILALLVGLLGIAVYLLVSAEGRAHWSAAEAIWRSVAGAAVGAILAFTLEGAGVATEIALAALGAVLALTLWRRGSRT